jgi:deoxyhypusine monooxygenase
MVRHEAAEAIGNLESDESVKVLEGYKEDEIIVVRHSCEVALDIHSYNNSNEFQYANQVKDNEIKNNS